jgi:hypothetical protein
MRFGLKVNPAGWDEAVQWAGVAEEAMTPGIVQERLPLSRCSLDAYLLA